MFSVRLWYFKGCDFYCEYSFFCNAKPVKAFQEPNLDFPCRWQSSEFSSHCPLPSWVGIIGNWIKSRDITQTQVTHAGFHVLCHKRQWEDWQRVVPVAGSFPKHLMASAETVQKWIQKLNLTLPLVYGTLTIIAASHSWHKQKAGNKDSCSTHCKHPDAGLLCLPTVPIMFDMQQDLWQEKGLVFYTFNNMY